MVRFLTYQDGELAYTYVMLDPEGLDELEYFAIDRILDPGWEPLISRKNMGKDLFDAAVALAKRLGFEVEVVRVEAGWDDWQEQSISAHAARRRWKFRYYNC